MQVGGSSRIILYGIPFEKIPGVPDELIFDMCKGRAMRRIYALGREDWPFPSIQSSLPSPPPHPSTSSGAGGRQ